MDRLLPNLAMGVYKQEWYKWQMQKCGAAKLPLKFKKMKKKAKKLRNLLVKS